MNPKFSRRQFLKYLTATAGAAGLAIYSFLRRHTLTGIAQDLGDRLFFPFITSGSQDSASPTATAAATQEPTQQPTQQPTPNPTAVALGARVVHVHSNAVTNWTGGDEQYWRYVSQSVVDQMVDQGLMNLTGKNNLADAWRTLLPNYQSGQNIAIKASFNNCRGCSDVDGQIDSVIEPFNAIIRGLKLIGVPESSIWIYDAVRTIPNRFKDGCAYSGVRFFDDGCGEQVSFSSSDPNAVISFNAPSGIGPLPGIRVCDVLVNANYLINVPIMKLHGGGGVSLGIKNHFGTIDHPNDLHTYIGRNASVAYDAQVDVFGNSHIRSKTILTVGDGLFAALMNYDPPSLWSTFGNQVPKSLYFSVDPVAVDSVMADFLDAEQTLPDYARWHLPLASAAGMGVYEIGDPWGSGYQQIDYRKLEL